MTKTLCVLMAVSASLWTTPAAHAQESLGKVSNAATVLRRAIELMPELAPEQRKWLRAGAGPIDESRTELLRSMEPSPDLLYQAGGMRKLANEED